MMTLLVYAAIILGITALVMIARVFDLSSELRGIDSWKPTTRDNKQQGVLYLLFMFAYFAFVAWQMIEYKDKLLPVAASIEGAETDWLLNFNFVIIFIVFVLTHIALCYFAFKYYGREDRVAVYYPHNNTLEKIWTGIPAVVLMVIIVLGLRLWTNITGPANPDAIIIELYAKQFDWTARYAGTDNILGKSNYRLIDSKNALGMDHTDDKGFDDIIAKSEFHIPKGKQVEFKIHARDVIHSAWMPHFRNQINAVPGMTTVMHFTPTITTDSMRLITKNPKFDYVLICNKICGASHYNMQMNVVVDEPAAYEAWLAKQKTAKETVFADMQNMIPVKTLAENK